MELAEGISRFALLRQLRLRSHATRLMKESQCSCGSPAYRHPAKRFS